MHNAQAELAAALLEEEWPDQRQAAAARAAAREAATPVPERVWALRNVGALLSCVWHFQLCNRGNPISVPSECCTRLSRALKRS